MYQKYSRRQFRSHMSSAMLLLACYKILVILVSVLAITNAIQVDNRQSNITIGGLKHGDSDVYLIEKSISAGVVVLAALTLLACSRMQNIYFEWASPMSIVFLLIYGCHCLIEPWLEVQYLSVNSSPFSIHF